MHNAPSVVYPLGRCAFQAWLFVLLGGVSAAVGVFFLCTTSAQSPGPGVWLTRSAGMLAWLAWTAWAFLSWTRSTGGSLHWRPKRGQEMDSAGAWWWTDSPMSEPQVLSEMERVLDLQNRVLLRFCGSNSCARWVWVDRQASPACWNDLRRALVSSGV